MAVVMRLSLNPGSDISFQGLGLGRTEGRCDSLSNREGQAQHPGHAGVFLVERSGGGFPDRPSPSKVPGVQSFPGLSFPGCWLEVDARFGPLWPCSGAGRVGRASGSRWPIL